MGIEELLREVQLIRNKYAFYEQKSGANFNILQVLNVADDEVRICRVLHELLNPQGSHGQGNIYLKLFVENVLHLAYDFKHVHVYREYTIPNGRRIDLAIVTENRFIPIEVKIYAEDQDKQCFDYYQMAKAPESETAYMYYLTLDGHIPSEESARGLTRRKDENGHSINGYDEVKCCSFATDILPWLNACLKADETMNIETLRVAIQQLIGAVENMTGQSDSPKEQEIIEMISSSSENMKNAMQLSYTVKSAQTSLLKKVFSSLVKRIAKNNNGKVLLQNEFYYDFPETKKADKFYEKGGTCPGISYYCMNLGNDIDLWFRIEIGDCLFFGFCTPKNNKWSRKQLTDEQAKELLGEDAKSSGVNDWWVGTAYVVDQDGSKYNFRYPDETYFKLYDESYFNTFIEDCYRQMKEYTDRHATKTNFAL